jgi:hypothetical protein
MEKFRTSNTKDKRNAKTQRAQRTQRKTSETGKEFGVKKAVKLTMENYPQTIAYLFLQFFFGISLRSLRLCVEIVF